MKGDRPAKPSRPWIEQPVPVGVELRNWPEHCGQRLIVERVQRHRGIYCGYVRITAELRLRCPCCGREGFRQDFDADPHVDRVMRQRMG
jgi:hypothetical protein